MATGSNQGPLSSADPQLRMDGLQQRGNDKIEPGNWQASARMPLRRAPRDGVITAVW